MTEKMNMLSEKELVLNTASSMRVRWRNRAPELGSFRTFRLLLLLMTAAAAMFFVIEAIKYVPVTGENVYPESAGVLAAQRWAEGRPLYEDYRQPPYLMTSFPPLWYAMLFVAAKFGLTGIDSLTLFGRLLSLFFLAGVALLGYAWNRRAGHSPKLAIFAPALYLAFPILIPWAVTARPDMPALFGSFLAVYLVSFRVSRRSVVLAAVAAALAFLMRHNAVAAPIAITVWLVLSRRWRDTALFCGVWGLIVASVLLPFQMSGQGLLLLLNLSSAKFGHLALTYIRDIVIRLLLPPGQGFAVLLFGLGTFALLQRSSPHDTKTRLLKIYLVASLALGVVGSAAAGGGVNHFLEAALAMAVLTPTALSVLERSWDSAPAVGACLTALLVILLLPTLDVRRWELMHRSPDDLRRVVGLVRDREVFVDDPYVAARALTPNSADLASLINTQRIGGWASWSSQGVSKAIAEKEFKLIVLSRPVEKTLLPVGRYPRAPRIDAAIQSAISQNYRFCFEVDSEYVYAPDSGGSGTISNCPTRPAGPSRPRNLSEDNFR
jgi:hypothetical protein